MKQSTVVIWGTLALTYMLFNYMILMPLQAGSRQNNQMPTPQTTVPTLQATALPSQSETSPIWGIEKILIPIVSLVLTTLIALLAYLYRKSEQTSQVALEAKIKAEHATETLQRVEDKVFSLDSQSIDLSRKVNELDSKSQTTSFLIDEFSKKLNGVYVSNTNEQLSLNQEIESSDKNKISDDEYVEQQQRYSWRKWVIRKNDTGWQELLEYASQDGGLSPSLRVVIETELDRVQQRIASANNPSQKDKDYASRLRQLLDIDKSVKR